MPWSSSSRRSATGPSTCSRTSWPSPTSSPTAPSRPGRSPSAPWPTSTSGWASSPPALDRVDGVPTIGVAVAIPEPWASHLQHYRASIGDTTAEKIPTHITLVPPTELEDRAEADAHLADVAGRHDAFVVHL